MHFADQRCTQTKKVLVEMARKRERTKYGQRLTTRTGSKERRRLSCVVRERDARVNVSRTDRGPSEERWKTDTKLILTKDN